MSHGNAFPARVVTFMAGASVPQFFGIVQAFLRQHRGIQSLDFVVGDRPYFEWTRAQTPRDPRIRIHYQHERLDPFARRGLDYDRLAALEARYGLPNLWRYIQAQRMIEHLEEERKVSYLQAYIEYFEDLYHDTKADLFITGTPDSLPFMVAAEVFRRNGCLTVALAPGRLPGRFFIVQNELEQIRGLAEAYEGLKRRELTPNERDIVQRLRAAYVKRRLRPSYYRRRPELSAVPSPVRLWRHLRRWFVNEDRYFDYPLWFYARRSVVVRARQLLQRRALRGLARPGVEDERFFYMPLNYEPECSIDVQSGYYRDQIAVVRQVVSGLPAGYALYVKEHPNMLPGARPLGFYRRLLDLGPVRLLPTETDSYDVLPRCHGVITIGGTTGVEALYYGKPVLLFGRAFYEVFQEGVFRICGFEDSGVGLRWLADTPRIDDAMFDRFVISVYERSYPGAYELTAEGAADPANYEAMASGISAEIRLLQDGT